MNTYGNPVLERLPLHLRQYLVEQHYERYTPIDQAVWRYVMRQNHACLKDLAYYPYIPGLRKAGLSIERIPDLQRMNDALGRIGWGAATVNGFIPPSAFMEFQAHRVLVIAADIRQIGHIAYTPAPDIIHESSGHAPIIGEPEYAEYLRYFGEIGAKAIFSHHDFRQYEAIRHLSILKERHDVTAVEIAAAEQHLADIQADKSEPSEMALLSRLHWWTVEYGLIGTLDDPKIYGAGLLSSIGESAACMRAEVPKLPYTTEAVNYPYDITRPQPQLFVTPDFRRLVEVLESFADTMAFRLGGVVGLARAAASRSVCTAMFSSGLQVSGVFDAPEEAGVSYIRTSGPTALAFAGKQLPGHGRDRHPDGFGSPVGRLAGADKPLDAYSDTELERTGIRRGKSVRLEFGSGICVKGQVSSFMRCNGKVVLISFADCRVTDLRTGKVLFTPEWGSYDMAVGEQIISVWCGAADKDAYEQIALVAGEQFPPPAYHPRQVRLHELYAAIRRAREDGCGREPDLEGIQAELATEHPGDWLASLELLELARHRSYGGLASGSEAYLLGLSHRDRELEKLIADGMRLIDRSAGRRLQPH